MTHSNWGRVWRSLPCAAAAPRLQSWARDGPAERGWGRDPGVTLLPTAWTLGLSMVHDLFIGAAVFACGWVLMSVEILGGRMLGPYFGTAIYTWGSIISVFLLALSLGYLLGGLLSRRVATLWVLVCIVAAAGGLIMLLPLYYRDLCEQLWDMGPRLGPLTASSILFLPPSVLLGMVSPYAIRLSTRTLDTVGLRSGVLYSVSTVGSFLGCLVTAFYFIGCIGIRQILLISGLLLVAVALLGVVVQVLSKTFTDGPESTLCSSSPSDPT